MAGLGQRAKTHHCALAGEGGQRSRGWLSRSPPGPSLWKRAWPEQVTRHLCWGWVSEVAPADCWTFLHSQSLVTLSICLGQALLYARGMGTEPGCWPEKQSAKATRRHQHGRGGQGPKGQVGVLPSDADSGEMASKVHEACHGSLEGPDTAPDTGHTALQSECG